MTTSVKSRAKTTVADLSPEKINKHVSAMAKRATETAKAKAPEAPTDEEMMAALLGICEGDGEGSLSDLLSDDDDDADEQAGDDEGLDGDRN